MSDKTIRYVVGFLFNQELSNVCLIRKLKPEWQKCLLNGVGGKIEVDESPFDAMIREFAEETGYPYPHWIEFGNMSGVNNDGSSFEVVCFCGKGPLDRVSTQEYEQVELHTVSVLTSGRLNTVANLLWLVPLAVDFLSGQHPPKHAKIIYGS